MSTINPNKNCLYGMQCPKCGSYGPFDILVCKTGTVTVYDGGHDDVEGDTEWLDDCTCRECGHEGTVAGFRGEEPSESDAMPAPQVEWRADGEANVYTLLTGGNWLASFRMNGELSVTKQEAYVARFAAAAGELQSNCKKWYAVTGRIPGDDEDSLYVFKVGNRDEAIQAFDEAIWADETDAEEGRKSVFREHGQHVFINSVVVSDSPITDIG